MTVSSTSNRVVYNGNASTTSFPFAFKVQNPADLVVLYTDASGTDFTLSPSQYAAVGFGLDAGGAVTYPVSGAPIALGTRLTLYRDVAVTQPAAISNQGAMWPSVIESALDRATYILQKVADSVSRALVISPTDSGTLNALPNATQRANSVLGFDASGQPYAAALTGNLVGVSTWLVNNFLTVATSAGNALTALGISTYFQTLLNTASNGGLLTTLGFSSFVQTLLGAADAPNFRALIDGYIVGSDVTSAATIDLDSTTGGAVPGSERGLTATSTAVALANPVATINGNQPVIRLVAKIDGITLTHNITKIVSRTASNIMMRAGDAVTLRRISAGKWEEVSFHPLPNWKSSNLTLTNGTFSTPAPHYLGKRVGELRLIGVAVASDSASGYAPSDFIAAGARVEFPRGMQTNVGWSAIVDDANVTVQVASSGLGYFNKTSGGSPGLDMTKWNFWLEIDARG